MYERCTYKYENAALFAFTAFKSSTRFLQPGCVFGRGKVAPYHLFFCLHMNEKITGCPSDCILCFVLFGWLFTVLRYKIYFLMTLKYFLFNVLTLETNLFPLFLLYHCIIHIHMFSFVRLAAIWEW